MTRSNLIILFASGLFAFCSQKEISPVTKQVSTPTTSLLQAISIVDNKITWASGHDATFIRTTDGGENWESFQHPTADTLQFRDIHAFDSSHVVLMSAGPGSLSRIFSFSAPEFWEENYIMQDSLGFLDCIDFWDEQFGIAYGDAFDSYPFILLTSDGGHSWHRADTTNMPKAGKGEGGFAASGTCVTTAGNGKAWIATGAGGNARFLVTEDYGLNWKSVDSPIVKGDAAGHTSISFIGETGLAVGGDLLKAEEYTENCAFSINGGETWNLTEQPKTKGAFYGGALSKVGSQYLAFACGPNGLDFSSDQGKSWVTLDTLNYWAVAMNGNNGFATGTKGKILKISLQ